METDKLMKHYVTTEFRDYAIDTYPSLLDKLKYRRFFQFLCFSSFYDKKTDRLIISAEDIWKAIRLDKNEPYNCHNFNAAEFLEEFRDNVLPPFSWTGYGKKKARQVFNCGWSDEFQARLDQETFTFIDVKEPANYKKYCNFVTGVTYRFSEQKKNRDMQEEQYVEMTKKRVLNPTQQKMVDYLEQVNGDRLFIRKFHQNKEKIIAAINAIDNLNSKRINYRIMNAIIETPQVYYTTTDRTARLTAIGENPTGLKRNVRKALCSGWTEFDLVSSQFAILASKLNAPISMAFIQSGKSIWNALYHHTHGINAPPPPAIKSQLKEIIYSICFGKSKIHSQSYFTLCKQQGKDVEDDLYTIAKRYGMPNILEHSIIKELLELRDKWHQEINQAGGAFNIWGQFVPVVEGERWHGSVASEIIQGIELEIISAVFDVAIEFGKNAQFQITLFQHDGGCLSFTDKTKKDRMQQYMQEAVKKKAASLGICTSLEFIDL